MIPLPEYKDRQHWNSVHPPLLPRKAKACDFCESVFNAKRSAHRSTDGYKRYCSNQCRFRAMDRGDEFQCLNCGSVFYMKKSKQDRRGPGGCCSKECRDVYYVGARCKGFRNGYVANARGEHMTLLPRQGYAGKYIGDHRLSAIKVIGRMLTRDEFVIRLDRNPEHNEPDNLFICCSNSEYSKRRSGSLPWPVKSNLMEYAATKGQP